MGWFGRDKAIDAWADAMRVDGAYQQGYAKGLEHGKASPLDDINRERHRRRLPPLVRQSVSPRQGQSAHQIDGGAGGGTYAAHHSYSVRGYPGAGGGGYPGPSEIIEQAFKNLSPSKETKMAKEKTHFLVIEGSTVIETTDHFELARHRAELLAQKNACMSYTVAKAIGRARTSPPTIWTDYE